MIADESLIRDTARGDTQAFSELVKRYQKKVIHLIYRFVANRADAEELAQEVFIKVWQHARTFKKKSAFSTWLYRITVNTSLNFKKGRDGSQKNLPLENAGDGPVPASEIKNLIDSQPPEVLERQEKEMMLRQAIALLPGPQRMALILSHDQGCRYAEIAMMMDVSRSAVESLLFRARQNLIKTIEKKK